VTDHEKHREELTEALENLGRALDPPEPDQRPVPPLRRIHYVADDAVERWAQQGRAFKAKCEATREQRKVLEWQITQTKRDARAATTDPNVHAFIDDLLPVMEAHDAAMRRLEKRIDERPAKQQREMFYWKNHQRADADLHNSILENGDHAAAAAVSRNVAKRLGLSDADIDAISAKRH
jgi:hypothetical protein